ncbi:MAG: O-antigen ligase family protein [Bdellovibrionales bacterium]
MRLTKLKKRTHEITFEKIGLFALLSVGAVFIPVITLPYVRDPFYLPKWHALCLVVAISLFVGTLRANQIRFPRVGPLCVVLAIALVFATIFNFFLHQTYLLQERVLGIVSFATLVVLAYNVFHENRQAVAVFPKVVRVSLATSTLLHVSIILGIASDGFSIRYEDLPFGFGNSNILAEALGLMLLFYGYYALRIQKELAPWDWALFLVSLNILALTECRSVYLGLVGAIVYSRSGNKKWFVLTSLFLTLGLILATWGITRLSPSSTETVLDRSSLMRLEFWAETWKLFLDHGTGVGIGKFDFEFLPYSRGNHFEPVWDLLVVNPHNEFLRWLAESGLHFTLIFVIFFLTLAFKIWKNSDATNREFFATVAIFILIQCAFQFPFLNAFSSYFVALLWGFFLAQANQVPVVVVRAGWLTKGLGITVSLVLLTATTTLVAAKYWDFNPSNLQDLERACRWDATNWRTCLHHAYATSEQGDLRMARKLTEAELIKNPNNYVAIEFIRDIYFKLWDWEKACTEQYHLERLIPPSPERRRVPLCDEMSP